MSRTTSESGTQKHDVDGDFPKIALVVICGRKGDNLQSPLYFFQIKKKLLLWKFSNINKNVRAM